MSFQEKKIRAFTGLKVWQEGHTLVVTIYRITSRFPKEELYSLTNQLRRAATSITSNIAEGFGRQGYKEKVQYYYIAQGSLTEVKNQLLIAKDIGYLEKSEYEKLEQQSNQTHRLLQGLITKSKQFANS
ncbi:MAG: four helix bundle protein [Patescibacteria group bacterium]